MTTGSRRIYAVFALLATLCWGAGVTMTKIALQDFPPPQLLIIQLLASVACLVLVAFVLGQVPKSIGGTVRVMWLGALEPGLAYFLGLEGLKRVSASEAVVLSSTESVMVVLLAWLMFRRAPKRAAIVLSILGGAGAVLVGGEHWNLGGQSLFGDLLIIGGVLCAAAYVVNSARVSADIEPLPALIGQQLVAIVVALTLSWVLADHFVPTAQVGWRGWAMALASGVVQYAAAFWFYLWALKGISATAAGLCLNLIPVFGLLISMPVLGERLGALQWVGAAAILVSVAALTWVNDEHAAPTRKQEQPCDDDLADASVAGLSTPARR
ncbi:MAG TPA: DMT family transporter [Steroidobacteraceae bacterium]|jgi:drug/metabolite transporter (DMT)-like permease